MSLSFHGALVAGLLLAALPAHAQTSLPGFELEHLEVNPGRGSVVVRNGELLVPGGLSVGLAGQYQQLPLVLRNGERRVELVRNRASAVLSGSYGLLPWLEVGAQIPVVLWQHGEDPGALGLTPLASQGLGTPDVQLRFGLLSRRDDHPVDLSLDLGVGLPLGSSPALARDAGLRVRALAAAGTQVGFLRASLEGGVLLRPRNPLSTPSTGQALEVRVGALVATTGQGLRGELAVRSAFAGDMAQPSVEVLAGGRLPLPQGLELFALAGPGLGSTPGTPVARVLLGVAYLSEPPPRLESLPEPVPHLRLEELPTGPPPHPPRDTAEPVPTRELLPPEPSP
ncbi:hypothetical protein D7V97_12965 [Corallococcus sp. CA053C]|uniref:hypothetical protein n=1 Tax=Corallococcus sp. CA053C TaxID=2316732 RepID=UPI000EA3268C|nr:hypothetical protein [Corallococcus sp. CA053C]RKH10770.1 hypothetical protein D7V97_12965 [Corallococcus sp. CA053C]